MSVEDQRHAENQQRFEAIEKTLLELKDFLAFLSDAKVGLRWAARMGKFFIFVGKIATGIGAIYAAWKFWPGGFK